MLIMFGIIVFIWGVGIYLFRKDVDRLIEIERKER